MALVIPKETYSGKIYNVQLGGGAKAVTIGVALRPHRMMSGLTRQRAHQFQPNLDTFKKLMQTKTISFNSTQLIL